MSTSPVNEKFPTWPNLLATLISGGDLSRDEAGWAMNEIMNGEASDVQIAGFLVALRAKGETVADLTGLVDSMVANARPLSVNAPTLDIVGTGGDRQNTVNISTMATLVCAGAGVSIVKHGNRASSSSSGSADVLEALGEGHQRKHEAGEEHQSSALLRFTTRLGLRSVLPISSIPRCVMSPMRDVN